MLINLFLSFGLGLLGGSSGRVDALHVVLGHQNDDTLVLEVLDASTGEGAVDLWL